MMNVAVAVLVAALGTLPSTTPRVEYTATGSQTAYPFSFKTTSTAHIMVYKDTVLQSTGVSVALNANQSSSPGGTVTFATAPAAGVVVRIDRTMPITQDSTFGGVTFKGAALDTQLDRVTMQTQQVDRHVSDAEATHATDKATQAAIDATQDATRNSMVAQARSDFTAGGGGFGDGSNILASGSSTARPLNKRFGEIVNVLDYGAKGDCIEDDLPHLNAATTASRAAGGVDIYLPHPTCAYRVTDTWLVGQGRVLSESDLGYVTGTNSDTDWTARASYSAANMTANALEPTPNITGDDSFIWGDFVSGSRKAILYYTAIGDMWRNERRKGSPHVEGLRFIGKEGIVAGARPFIDYYAPLASTNHQVGLAYYQTRLVVERCGWEGLDVGLFTLTPYWGSGSQLKFWHNNVGLYATAASNTSWSDISSYYNREWGAVMSGDGIRLGMYGTEQNVRDIWFPFADYLHWDVGYIESTTSNGDLAWAPLTAYSSIGAIRKNGIYLYQVISTGTSAGSGGPLTTTADITDGTVHWKFIGGSGAVVAPWVASFAYSTVGAVATNGDNLYKVIATGTSAGAGGPTTTATDITDGSVHWQYLGSAFRYVFGDSQNSGDTFQVGRSEVNHVKFNASDDRGLSLFAASLEMHGSRIKDDQTMVADVNSQLVQYQMDPAIVYASGSRTDRVVTYESAGATTTHTGSFNADGFTSTKDFAGFLANRAGGGFMLADAGAMKWQMYMAAGDPQLYFRDLVNSRASMYLVPGADSTATKLMLNGRPYIGGNRLDFGVDDTGPRFVVNAGSPAGAVSAPVGSIFIRTDGGAGTSIYVKESGGAGNTGWVGK